MAIVWGVPNFRIFTVYVRLLNLIFKSSQGRVDEVEGGCTQRAIKHLLV